MLFPHFRQTIHANHCDPKLRVKWGSSLFKFMSILLLLFLTSIGCGAYAFAAEDYASPGAVLHYSFRFDQQRQSDNAFYARPMIALVSETKGKADDLNFNPAIVDLNTKPIRASQPKGYSGGTSDDDATSGLTATAGAALLTAQSTTTAPLASDSSVRGVTDTEVRFGIVAPFSGPAKELGRQMMVGINAAFSAANDAGGIAGRKIKLMAKDDGYEPGRTLDAMKQLRDDTKVFGFIGNVGTPTAAVALPYALNNRMLFFGAFTGANILRPIPPDRYVFNYRPSYAEETEAVVRYLVKVRNIRASNIAVFAQQDAFGDAGFDGVARALRGLNQGSGSALLRMGYVRNSIDVNDAVAQLKLHRKEIRAVVMVATYRAAAKFIEKTRPDFPNLIYTNVSFVGSSELAEELILLGPTFADNIIVTQTVPAIGGFSSAVLEYKSNSEKYFPGQAPNFVAFEGYIDAKILLEGLRRAGRKLDTETLIDTLEAMRGFELGLGSPISFTPSEHQGSHRVWGTRLNTSGQYDAIDLD